MVLERHHTCTHTRDTPIRIMLELLVTHMPPQHKRYVFCAAQLDFSHTLTVTFSELMQHTRHSHTLSTSYTLASPNSQSRETSD